MYLAGAGIVAAEQDDRLTTQLAESQLGVIRY